MCVFEFALMYLLKHTVMTESTGFRGEGMHKQYSTPSSNRRALILVTPEKMKKLRKHFSAFIHNTTALSNLVMLSSLHECTVLNYNQNPQCIGLRAVLR